MRTLATLLAAAAIAAFGLTGTAQATHPLELLNGDAEAGLSDWDNIDAAMGAVDPNASDNIDVDSDGDAAFFSTGEVSVGSGGSAMMDQTVNVWGCGVEYLQGDFAVSGIFATGTGDGEDSGKVTTKFFDANGNLITTIATASLRTSGAGDWAAITGLGTMTVPEGAADMNVKIQGTDGNANAFADVGFDNLDLDLTDCLKNFAKISGKTGVGSKKSRGRWSFEGSVGTLHDAPMNLTGDIEINYKTEGQLCVFTPTAITYPVETTADVSATYDCNAGELTGTAVLRLIGGTESDNSNKDKDRGDICVDAETHDQLDIQFDGGTDSMCDDDSETVALKNGNVHVDADTSDVF